MKNKLALLMGIFLSLGLLTACHTKKTTTSRPMDEKSIQSSQKSKELKEEVDKTPDQIEKEEGIAAEQIVVSISDDGFVTSHGDHYHFYNGEVPYDSLFSSDVLAPEGYQFDQSHVLYEVKNGYIVKVDDQFCFYLSDPEHKDNLRIEKE
ncbi:pneumococcal-type histidine triad protein [Streptococcus ictaluri]|uniref:Histidine triad domain protein n=1 Tax=Streptococcus ictaluri 707-05 TaxID=764299 RepID=G5K3C0_9STRE|nr:pneumococcal-type histidine triad protein [Streptococcus ictaluri]EHI69554.1 histidine triad domain protein [Streptococcus ictaluri 707-05]